MPILGESEVAPSSVVIHNTGYTPLKEVRCFDPIKPVSNDLKNLKISAFKHLP